MSATPAAPHLMDFGSAASRSALALVGRRERNDAGDAAARIAEAHASGVESGKASVMATLEARLEEQRVLFARQLATEREAWAAQEGAKLESELAAGLRALEAQIADAVTRVLAPIIDAQLCHRAVADLRADLEVLLAKDASLSVTIAGPEDLLQALRKELSDKTCAVSYIARAGPEVRIAADQTILETRLAAWKAKLEEASP